MVMGMFRVDAALTTVHIGGACLICRDPNDIVDTEIGIPYEGVVAICTRCCKDLAMTAGWDVRHTEAEWAALTDSENESRYIADSLLEATDALTTTLGGLKRKHRNRLRQFQERTRKAKQADE